MWWSLLEIVIPINICILIGIYELAVPWSQESGRWSVFMGLKMANCSIILLPIRLSEFRAIDIRVLISNPAAHIIYTDISALFCVSGVGRTRACMFRLFTTQYSVRHRLSHTCTHQLPLRFLSTDELAGNWPTLEVHTLLIRSRKNSVVPSTKTLLHVFKKNINSWGNFGEKSMSNVRALMVWVWCWKLLGCLGIISLRLSHFEKELTFPISSLFC